MPEPQHKIAPESTRIEDDSYVWRLEQAALLKAQRFSMLDWKNLAEELEAMAASERREMKKQVKKLLAPLLKCQAQPNELNRHHSWKTSIQEAREDVADLLDDMPSIFQGKREEMLAVCFERALSKATNDTGLPLEDFPAACPWTFEQIMRKDFFPGIPRKK